MRIKSTQIHIQQVETNVISWNAYSRIFKNWAKWWKYLLVFVAWISGWKQLLKKAEKLDFLQVQFRAFVKLAGHKNFARINAYEISSNKLAFQK